MQAWLKLDNRGARFEEVSQLLAKPTKLFQMAAQLLLHFAKTAQLFFQAISFWVRAPVVLHVPSAVPESKHHAADAQPSADALLFIEVGTKLKNCSATWTSFERFEEFSEFPLEPMNVFELAVQLSLHFAKSAPLDCQALSFKFRAPVVFHVSPRTTSAPFWCPSRFDASSAIATLRATDLKIRKRRCSSRRAFHIDRVSGAIHIEYHWIAHAQRVEMRIKHHTVPIKLPGFPVTPANRAV